MKMLVSTVSPYEWVRLDKHDKPVGNGQFSEVAFLNTIPKQVTSVIGVAPASSTILHSLDIPTKNKSNLLSAIPFALEESLSEDIDDLHFTLLSWVPGGTAHVAVIAKQMLEQWTSDFAEMGVKFDKLILEHSLLPIHPSCEAIIIEQEGNQYAVKTGDYQSFNCDQEALEYWWSDAENRQKALSVNETSFAEKLKASGGENVAHWDIGQDFRAWLAHAPEQLNKASSLLQGAFEPEHLKPKSSWLNAALGIAASALLLLGVSNWIEAGRLQKEYDDNQQAIRALFEENFPDEEYLNRPRRQIASLLSISEDNPSKELFQYLLEFSSEVVPENNAEFEEINYRDGQLQIGVSAPSFSALENMTAQINAEEDLQAALISSGTKGQRVTGQIKMVRR